MATITITHQTERTQHHYTVKNPDSLTRAEVNNICQDMYVRAILVNGKFYESSKPLDFDKHLKELTKKSRKRG